MTLPRRARALLPCLALSALVSVHCSSSTSSDDDDDGGSGNGGQAGEPATGDSSGAGGASAAGSGTTVPGTTGGTGGHPGSGGGVARGGGSGAPDGGADATPGDAGASGSRDSGSGGASGGKGGATGSGGNSGCGASVGYEIVPEPGGDPQRGWVSASTNCMGVSGPISVSHDAGSSITLTSLDDRICVSGHTEQGASAVADRSSGARISIQLNNPDDAATPLSYDALDQGVHGYRFKLTGASVPPELRPTFHIVGTETDYCRRICATGLQSALFNDSDAYCWDGTGALQTGVAILALELAIPSLESGDVDFDFCIEDIVGITDNTSVGNPGTCG